MILPNKFIQEDDALIGVGATLLQYISPSTSLSELWENVKGLSNIGNFERFILGLDLLFIFGLINLRDNQIVRIAQ